MGVFSPISKQYRSSISIIFRDMLLPEDCLNESARVKNKQLPHSALQPRAWLLLSNLRECNIDMMHGHGVFVRGQLVRNRVHDQCKCAHHFAFAVTFATLMGKIWHMQNQLAFRPEGTNLQTALMPYPKSLLMELCLDQSGEQREPGQHEMLPPPTPPSICVCLTFFSLIFLVRQRNMPAPSSVSEQRAHVDSASAVIIEKENGGLLWRFDGASCSLTTPTANQAQPPSRNGRVWYQCHVTLGLFTTSCIKMRGPLNPSSSAGCRK